MNNVSFAGRETMLTKSPLVKQAEDKFHQYLSPGHIFNAKEIKEAKSVADKVEIAAKKVKTASPEAIYTSGRAPIVADLNTKKAAHIDYFG